MGNWKKPKNKSRKSQDSKTEELADDLLAFEEFRTKIVPELRKMMTDGKSSKEMLKKFAPYATARGISIALMEPDAGKAMTAIKDIMDRDQGRATEIKKIEHSMANMDDTELDALLKSEEAELSRMESGEDDEDKVQ